MDNDRASSRFPGCSPNGFRSAHLPAGRCLQIQRQILKAAGRRDHGLFPVEGPRVLKDAFRAGWRPEWVVVKKGEEDILSRITEDAELGEINLVVADERTFEKVCDAGTPQPVTAAMSIPDGRYNMDRRIVKEMTAQISEASGEDEFPVWIMTAGVQEPGNIGATIRCAAALGAAGVLCVGGADPYGPKSVRSSAGAIFRIPVHFIRSSPETDIYQFVDCLRAQGWTFAATGSPCTINFSHCHDKSKTETIDSNRLSVYRPGPLLIGFGSEGHGLPLDLLGRADSLLYIELLNEIESLNVAASCGIILSGMRLGTCASGSGI